MATETISTLQDAAIWDSARHVAGRRVWWDLAEVYQCVAEIVDGNTAMDDTDMVDVDTNDVAETASEEILGLPPVPFSP